MAKRLIIGCVLMLAVLLGAAQALAQSEGQIGGIVYIDENGNGIREEGEEGVQDAEVRFDSGGWNTTINTASNGAFSLAVNPATWSVSVVNAPSNSGLRVPDDAVEQVAITTPGEAVTNLEFGLIPAADEADGDLVSYQSALPASGGPISEALVVIGLVGLVIVGAGLVILGRLRGGSQSA